MKKKKISKKRVDKKGKKCKPQTACGCKGAGYFLGFIGAVV